MVATESKGRWGRLAKATVQPGGAVANSTDLSGIACQGLGSCVAAGYYKTTGDAFPPMTATRLNGRWTRAFRVRLPANSATGAREDGFFYAVACPRIRLCVAVGYYRDKAGHLSAMADATPA